MHVITTHKATDFDALASMVAASILYPEATPVVPKSLNPNVRAFLSIHKDIFEMPTVDALDLDQVQRLIVVDTNAWSRLDGFGKLRGKAGLQIHLWDHHLKGGDFRADWRCQEAVGATVTLLIRRLKEQRKLISPIQATLFLTGIYEDTGNMTFASVTAEDAHAAAWLLERKADLSVLNAILRPACGEKQKNVLFDMLKSAQRTIVNGYCLSLNVQEVSGHIGNLSVVVNMYQEIMNVDAAFGIFSDAQRGKCMVIGRSNVDGLDMGIIMRALGGGGHPGAGSALLASAAPEAVKERICSFIEGNQQVSVKVGDLMSFPVATVSVTTPMEQVARVLRKKGCTGLPVMDGQTLVGVISRRDFRKIKKDSQLKAPVKAYMSVNPLTIEARQSPIQAARLMVKRDIGRLPVMQDGKMVGIITRSDAMLYFYDMLPD
jgi:tRNA nucleotidyltransferase (CCA-adding enzyme)